MHIMVSGIPSNTFRALREGGLDANGQPPEHTIANGGRSPCRHCLSLIADGEERLILSYRPFEHVQAYAETGPIFLHGRDCPRYRQDRFPDWFVGLDPALVRGYDADHRICYETGTVVRGAEIADACRSILANPGVAYVHVRSRFNCFQCRVDRA